MAGSKKESLRMNQKEKIDELLNRTAQILKSLEVLSQNQIILDKKIDVILENNNLAKPKVIVSDNS